MNGKTQGRSEFVVHGGELIQRRRLQRRAMILTALGLAWLVIFLLVPSAMLVPLSFAKRGSYGEIVWSPTVENYRRLFGYGLMGWSPDQFLILWRSVWVAGVTTVVSILLAYPMAFFIALQPRRLRFLWLAIVTIPLCTNLVIRTYGWILLFDSNSWIAELARKLGWIEEYRGLVPGAFAVYVGMISNSLPFAVLPLFASVERMDWSLLEAAQDLYASRTGVFRHAVLPQTSPGLRAAIILTFIPSLGIFVIPDLLGGSKYMLVGNLIQQQFGTSRDWPFGAAICFGLIAVTLLGLWFMREDSRAADQSDSF